MGDDGGLAVEPRSPSAPAKPSVPAPQATPTSGTRSADVAGAASPPAVLDMAAAGRAGPVQAGGGPGSTPASAAAVSSPAASSAAGELTQLDSDDPATRATAVQNLAERRDERGWRLLLLAQQSRFADVRAAATALSLRKLGVDPSFELFLRQLATRSGDPASDLAIRTLTLAGARDVVDMEAYRRLLHQRLELAQVYLTELDDQLYELVTSMTKRSYPRTAAAAFPVLDQLGAQIDALPADNLADLGVQIATLLRQLAVVRVAAGELRTGVAQVESGSGLRKVIQQQLLTLLLDARHLSGASDDPAFARIGDSLSAWPRVLARATVKELRTQLLAARGRLEEAFNRRIAMQGPAAQRGWARIHDEVVRPLQADIDLMVQELELLQPVAESNPENVFGQLAALEPNLRSIVDRALYLQQSALAMEGFEELALTGDANRDNLRPAEGVLWAVADRMATLAAMRDTDPEGAKRFYDEIVNSPEFQEANQVVENWREVINGELAFAQLVADILIIIIAVETGGLAAGLVRGLFGEMATVAGRVAVGSLAFAANVTAFTVTNRGLHALLGQAPAHSFQREWIENALLFGLLEGTGAVYKRFVAARLPVALRSAGGMTATFTAFQAWSVALTRYDTGEWVSPGSARFWRMAGQNALLLAAVHLGRPIARPLVAPLEQRLLRFRVEQHNARCAEFGARMSLWEASGTDNPVQALAIIRQGQALYRERLGVLRDINRLSPSELTDAELADAAAVMEAQIQAANNALFQRVFRVVADPTAPGVMYYDGDPAAFAEQYESQGFKVLEVTPEGRMRVLTPEGETVDLIRTEMRPTGAGRTLTDAEAEAAYERIRGMADDVPRIAANTGIPARVVRAVRRHVFLAKHEVPVGPKEVRRMRFTADVTIADLWSRAAEGQLETEDLARFRRLMAHEYVELKLMAEGTPYHSAQPGAWRPEKEGFSYWPSPEHFGAHDLAPHAAVEVPAFAHWRAVFGLEPTAATMRRLGVPIEDWMGIDVEPGAPTTKAAPIEHERILVMPEQLKVNRGPRVPGRSWDLSFSVDIGGETVTWGLLSVPLDAAGNPIGPPEMFLDTRVTVGGRPVILDLPGTASFTRIALEEGNRSYQAEFSAEAEFLSGTLADKNLLNFQREFATAKQENPSLSDAEAARLAVGRISFGRHRAAIGYSELNVTISSMELVRLGPPLGVRTVPTIVRVTAGRPAGP